jgi:DNA-binding NarL/FixJ family response regulator
MKKSVVIVEGYDELRGHLEAILESATDILCLGAFDSGEEARPEILERRPDVVLMDFNLPGRSGIQWVAEIKTVLPAIHVIMVPVYEANALIFQALKAGASG